MRSELLWRRSATAAGLYLVGRARHPRDDRRRPDARARGLRPLRHRAGRRRPRQTLLDLTVEEALTKFGFRYVAAEDWGKLHRLFGGRSSSSSSAARSPRSSSSRSLRSRTRSSGPTGSRRRWPPRRRSRSSPAPENVAATALLLRGRYDLRGPAAVRDDGAPARRDRRRRVDRRHGRDRRLVVGQLIATAVVGTAGASALRRFPPARARARSASDRREILSFVVQSSVATGMVSLRAALAPLLLGVVAGTTQVGSSASRRRRRAASPRRARPCGSSC